MAITPQQYAPSSLVGPAGVWPGRQVLVAQVSRLGRNHNALWGSYCPALCQATLRRGGVASTTAGSYVAILLLPLAPSVPARTVTVRVWAKHSGSGVDAHIRAKTSAATSSATTIATSATSWTSFDCTVQADGSVDQVVLEVDSPEVTVAAALVYRRIDYGVSVSDSPTQQWRFWDSTSEQDTDGPLTAEHIGRMTVGPGQVWKQNVAALASGAECLSGAVAHDWTDGEDVAWTGQLGVRGVGRLRIRSYLVGTSGHVVQFRIGDRTYELETSEASLSSHPYPLESVLTDELQPGMYPAACRVVTSGSGSSRLYAFAIHQEAP